MYVDVRHTRCRKRVVCTAECSHKFAHIHICTHARTRRQTEHWYGATRLHRLARSCEETMAREISSLRNLDEIARITWEPGRYTYLCSRTRGRIHAIVGFRARSTVWIARMCCARVCGRVYVPLHGNSGRSDAPSCRGRVLSAECASGEKESDIS